MTLNQVIKELQQLLEEEPGYGEYEVEIANAEFYPSSIEEIFVARDLVKTIIINH